STLYRMHSDHHSSNWHRLAWLNLQYSHLYAEMHEYCHFWTSHLSVIFVFFVLILCYIMYVFLFTIISLYVDLVFSLAFCFHITILGVIIHYCGAVVHSNEVLSSSFTSNLPRFRPMPMATRIKVVGRWHLSACSLEFLLHRCTTSTNILGTPPCLVSHCSMTI